MVIYVPCKLCRYTYAIVGEPCIGQHSCHAYPCTNAERLFITDVNKPLTSFTFPLSQLLQNILLILHLPNTHFLILFSHTTPDHIAVLDMEKADFTEFTSHVLREMVEDCKATLAPEPPVAGDTLHCSFLVFNGSPNQCSTTHLISNVASFLVDILLPEPCIAHSGLCCNKGKNFLPCVIGSTIAMWSSDSAPLFRHLLPWPNLSIYKVSQCHIRTYMCSSGVRDNTFLSCLHCQVHQQYRPLPSVHSHLHLVSSVQTCSYGYNSMPNYLVSCKHTTFTLYCLISLIIQSSFLPSPHCLPSNFNWVLCVHHGMCIPGPKCQVRDFRDLTFCAR